MDNLAKYAFVSWLTLSGLALFFTALSVIFPQVAWLARAASACGTFAADVQKLFGLSPTPTPSPDARRGQRGFIRFPLLAGISFIAISMAVACGVVQSVAPTVVPLATCVANDAIAKKTLSQMVTDCGGDLLAVLQALLESTDPQVTSSPAYVEAQRIASAMAARKAVGK